MYRLLLLALLPLTTYALEVSVDIAKDNFQKYSVFHLQDKNQFTCEAIHDDFGESKQVVCAFSKKPVQHIKQFSNEFFTVTTLLKKGTFFLSIKPKYKMQLFANVFDLTKESAVYTADASLSQEWFVVGYKKKMPLLQHKEHSDLALNFPVYLEKDKMPYVGSLDIKGNPVFIKKVEDVSEFIKVKKYFQEKNYDRCLEITQDILEKYPNTLFKSELLYYEIKIYFELQDYDNVIDKSKTFLREFSADHNVAEVLSLVSYAYGKTGLFSDSDYFFDRLFSEHKGSKYAQMGYIYKGALLEEAGGSKEAEKFYKKALYETQDIDVAVEASYHLAMLKLQIKAKDSVPYFDKILKAKPSFFKEHFQDSMKLVKTLASYSLYDTAAKIVDVLLQSIDPTYDEYEELLAYKGLYLAHTDKKKEALTALNDYMKKFPDGDFYEEASQAKDQLFFSIEDLNTTVKLQELNRLLDEYEDEDILDKALYEKAKVLNKMGKYNDVLALTDALHQLDEERFEDVDSIIQEAAVGAMQKALEKNECDKVIIISSDHNVTLSSKWDDKIYGCAMQGGDFQLAKSMVNKNLDAKDISEKMQWLYRYIKVNFATGSYEDVLSAAKDLIKLIEMEKTQKYNDVYRILFDTYSRLEKQDDMMQAMNKIEEVYKDHTQDIDRYAEMIAVGVAKNDENIVVKYGSKLFDIQQRTNSHAQSPYVEFSLYDAYTKLGEYRKALEVIQALDNIALKKEQRARQKYLLGNAFAKLWKDEKAQEAYDAAIKADPKSAWAKLAQSAKEL